MEKITLEEIKSIIKELRVVYGYKIRKVQSEHMYRFEGQIWSWVYFKKRLLFEKNIKGYASPCIKMF